MKRLWRLQNALSVLFLLASLASCWCPRRQESSAYSNPPPTLENSDLVGIWQAVYSGHEVEGGLWGQMTGVETLILGADGMYQQVYDNERGHVQVSPRNKWSVERLPDGRVQIHLVGAHFYPLEARIGEDLVGRTWAYDTSNDGTGHPLHLDGTEVILIVKVLPEQPEEVYLDYPPVGDPDNPVIVTFQRVSTLVLTPTLPP